MKNRKEAIDNSDSIRDRLIGLQTVLDQRTRRRWAQAELGELLGFNPENHFRGKSNSISTEKFRGMIEASPVLTSYSGALAFLAALGSGVEWQENLQAFVNHAFPGRQDVEASVVKSDESIKSPRPPVANCDPSETPMDLVEAFRREKKPVYLMFGQDLVPADAVPWDSDTPGNKDARLLVGILFDVWRKELVVQLERDLAVRRQNGQPDFSIDDVALRGKESVFPLFEFLTARLRGTDPPLWTLLSFDKENIAKSLADQDYRLDFGATMDELLREVEVAHPRCYNGLSDREREMWAPRWQ